MAIIEHNTGTVHFKIVYHGPGLSGKTSHISYIYYKTNPQCKGKMISLATETERTLFFDFLPIYLGKIRGYQIRYNLYSVPGQVFYHEPGRMVLRGADGVVFVADSQEERMEANIESLQMLNNQLLSHGISPDSIPMVFSYNKRDLPNAVPVNELNKTLNSGDRYIYHPTTAVTGDGVFDTLKDMAKEILRSFKGQTKSFTLDDRMSIDVSSRRQKIPSKPAFDTNIQVNLDAQTVFSGEWNLINFNILREGNRDDEILVQISCKDSELVTYQSNNSFKISAGESQLQDYLWVKPGLSKVVSLEYTVGSVSLPQEVPVIEGFEFEETMKVGDVELVTIMLIDVEGSTDIWKNHPDAVLIMENLKHIVATCINPKGKINKSIGDAFSVTFSSASEAVIASKLIMETVERRNYILDKKAVRIKIGIDTGEVLLKDMKIQNEPEVFGKCVIRATRLCDVAKGGEIFLSARTFSLADDSISTIFKSRSRVERLDKHGKVIKPYKLEIEKRKK